MLDATMILRASGGVSIPTDVLTIMIMPIVRGWTPIWATIGRSMGVTIKMRAFVSRAMPNTSSMTLSMIMIMMGLSEKDKIAMAS